MEVGQGPNVGCSAKGKNCRYIVLARFNSSSYSAFVNIVTLFSKDCSPQDQYNVHYHKTTHNEVQLSCYKWGSRP
jgi:hypothetical protein